MKTQNPLILRPILLFLVFGIIAFFNSQVHATPIPAVSITGSGDSFNNQTQTQGWEFSPTVGIQVVSLGLFDGETDGLVDPHEIGLWNTSGILLTSITIPEGVATTKVDNFRYIDIPQIRLRASQNYVIGALYLGIQGGGTLDPDPEDRDIFFDGSPASFAPEITFVDQRISTQQTSGLTFPTVMTSGPAILGPSFLFQAIPEPSTYLLFAIGILGLLGIGHQDRKKVYENK